MTFFIQLNAFLTLVSTMGINRGFGKRRERSKVRVLGAKKPLCFYRFLSTHRNPVFIEREICSIYYILLESVVNRLAHSLTSLGAGLCPCPSIPQRWALDRSLNAFVQVSKIRQLCLLQKGQQIKCTYCNKCVRCLIRVY